MLFNGTDTGAPLKHALLSYNISHGLSIHIFGKIAKTTTKIQEKEKSMIGKYRMRTDLAMENQEKFERDHVEISGVEIEKKKRKAEIQTTIVKITSEQGAKMMGKAERDVCDDRSAAAFDGRRGGEPESGGGVFPLSDGNGAGSVRIRSCGRPRQPRHHAGCARAGDGGAA